MNHRSSWKRPWRLVLLGLMAVSLSAAKTPDSGSAHEGWPATPAGRAAAGWVDAFAGGEKAMRAYFEAHLTKESLAKRPMDERLRSYRDLHGQMGDLVLGSVEASAPHELTVVLLAEDASRHRFRFKVGEEAPHALLEVAILQHATMHGGGHGQGSH